ncbi:MAG TPA: aromatic-ring-hydroxylating dioxygenase subunit beta [Stellaceae bacterium]|jgi:3-phenylpropionate/cinnamic acid dioxygenase small subunit
MTPDEVVRRLELEALYADYAFCLDNDRLEDWPGFFTEDCTYRVTSAENFEAGMRLGIIYATSRNMLVDRVMALRKANIYEPQRYRHLVANLRIEKTQAAPTGAIAVTANFLVVRTMQDGAMTLFAAGRYVDRVVRGGDSWKFARKDAVLDSRQIDTLLAIPI